MAKMIKFDLPIDGVKVATLEDLRDHFTTEVIGHFRSGLLARWLRSRRMASELTAVEAMTLEDDEGILRQLCGIFGVVADDVTITAAVGEATGTATIRVGQQLATLQPGATFRDAPKFPELVVVPTGSFMMRGSTFGESVHHEVKIDYPLAVGAYPVTFEEWDACVSEGGCGGYNPFDKGWGRGDRPIINVSWETAKMYVEWLSWKSGRGYRLLSEAEWEYCARAGTTTEYWWGDEIGVGRTNCRLEATDHKTSPVGSFSANAFGLYDVHGNVNEWVEDSWAGVGYRRVASSRGTPTDGSPHRGTHPWRVLRGGSWKDFPSQVRAASRKGRLSSKPGATTGLRVARTLERD